MAVYLPTGFQYLQRRTGLESPDPTRKEESHIAPMWRKRDRLESVEKLPVVACRIDKVGCSKELLNGS